MGENTSHLNGFSTTSGEERVKNRVKIEDKSIYYPS
jgi:hypothetical protein